MGKSKILKFHTKNINTIINEINKIINEENNSLNMEKPIWSK